MADKQTTFSAPVKNSLFSVTCCAPVNIAVIKYWGKRDEKLILPINGSVSATLCENELQAKTTAAASKEFKSDRMWLNGKERNMDSERLQNVLREIKRRVRKRKSGDSNASDLLNYHVHICSENNFPTAAGLASSAAGYACLVYTLAKLFGVSGDITEIARQGSGSACRSLHGGFVEWVMGDKEDGSDSLGRQVVDHTHWPEMRILILVVSDQKKQVGSTSGMQTSVLTSHLLNYRARHVVPDRITKMNEAIRARDFTTFAEITMKDSNQLHATCLDTYPPVFYMNDTSRKIIQFVHGFNSYCGETKVAYTFDAGPNACLYLLEKDVPTVLALVQHYFKPPSTNGGQFLRGMTSDIQQPEQNLLKAIPLEQTEGVKYIIHTKVGAGPRQLEDSESLLGDNGLPKSSSSL